jgi:antitoxin component YwqK of YwqJK toxin-antitoxin module
MDFVETIASQIPDLKTLRNFAALFPDVTRLYSFEVLPSGNSKKLLLFFGEIYYITEFDDGVKVVESARWDGVKNGVYRELNENGVITREGRYLNGKEQGFWKTHDDEEGIYNEGNYDKGIITGIWLDRYENGQIRRQSSYRNGKWEGTFITYDREGNITSMADYFNNLLV